MQHAACSRMFGCQQSRNASQTLQLSAGLPLPPRKRAVANNGLVAAPTIHAGHGCVGKRSKTAQSRELEHPTGITLGLQIRGTMMMFTRHKPIKPSMGL